MHVQQKNTFRNLKNDNKKKKKRKRKEGWQLNEHGMKTAMPSLSAT
jgi:hypothetical protein